MCSDGCIATHFAHRPTEGVYNIVSLDNDMIVRVIDFLTITPTNEEKKEIIALTVTSIARIDIL
jgi:hypothetical protein